MRFEYGEAELEHLRKRDKRLGAVIDRVGMIERKVTPDLFEALASSIVSQQISSKAADTVWGRVRDRFAITPQAFAQASVPDIQSCGMSTRKATYVKGIAEAIVRGDLDLARVATLSDEEVIHVLSAWPGIGAWTGEMMLIFSLGRPDVVSWDDLAIRRGMMRLYGHKTLTREQFARYRKRYSPFGSVASLYLWELSVSE